MKPLPHFSEGETAVLGALFREPSKASAICRQLSKEDFYHSPNALLFDALKRMTLSGVRIDPVSAMNALLSENLLDAIGGDGSDSLNYLTPVHPPPMSSTTLTS